MRTLFLPPTYQDSAESGRLILRDGSAAFIRLSEPADLDALKDFFYQLSPESRKRRFFSSAEPSEALLPRQCDSSNPRSQLTLIVSRIVEGTSRIIATGSYVARDETSAEVAFAVDDEFQGKGLGGLLLERLALLAARHGFVRFWALTLLENRLMLETFRQSGFPIHSKIEDECVEIDFSVAPSEDSVSRSETEGPGLHDRLAPSLLPAAVRRGRRRVPRPLRVSASAFSAHSFRGLSRPDLRGEPERDARRIVAGLSLGPRDPARDRSRASWRFRATPCFRSWTTVPPPE